MASIVCWWKRLRRISIFLTSIFFFSEILGRTARISGQSPPPPASRATVALFCGTPNRDILAGYTPTTRPAARCATKTSIRSQQLPLPPLPSLPCNCRVLFVELLGAFLQDIHVQQGRPAAALQEPQGGRRLRQFRRPRGGKAPQSDRERQGAEAVQAGCS